jgi:hypothetical protein
MSASSDAAIDYFMVLSEQITDTNWSSEKIKLPT